MNRYASSKDIMKPGNYLIITRIILFLLTCQIDVEGGSVQIPANQQNSPKIWYSQVFAVKSSDPIIYTD